MTDHCQFEPAWKFECLTAAISLARDVDLPIVARACSVIKHGCCFGGCAAESLCPTPIGAPAAISTTPVSAELEALCLKLDANLPADGAAGVSLAQILAILRIIVEILEQLDKEASV